MKFSQGAKLCNECFLKFLSFIECNRYMYEQLLALPRLSYLSPNEKINLIKKLRDYEFFYLVVEIANRYEDLKNKKLGSENVKQFVDRIKECMEFRALLGDLTVMLERSIEYVSISSEK